ncbi:hypothetical protein CcaverHIS002_0100240 [Cutaneotrichosporon cavernicola]|nr:hypothetical protein CcaverHIS002_0100240 [Cutaneotrichosporon cavernicola]
MEFQFSATRPSVDFPRSPTLVDTRENQISSLPVIPQHTNPLVVLAFSPTCLAAPGLSRKTRPSWSTPTPSAAPMPPTARGPTHPPSSLTPPPSGPSNPLDGPTITLTADQLLRVNVPSGEPPKSGSNPGTPTLSRSTSRVYQVNAADFGKVNQTQS